MPIVMMKVVISSHDSHLQQPIEEGPQSFHEEEPFLNLKAQMINVQINSNER